ncbi:MULTISPECIES: hypothetical protein [unclassified Nonomuraea]
MPIADITCRLGQREAQPFEQVLKAIRALRDPDAPDADDDV